MKQFDETTVEVGGGRAIVAMWSYTLGTDDEVEVSFASCGQLLLRDDGVVFRRVRRGEPNEFGRWKPIPRDRLEEPRAVADVERLFDRSSTRYVLSRIDLPERRDEGGAAGLGS